MGTGKKNKPLWVNTTVKNIFLFWQGIFIQIYFGIVHSADEKQGKESRDMTSAQICTNRDIVNRAFEKLIRSSNATVN